MRFTFYLLGLAAALSAAAPATATVVIPGMAGRDTVRIGISTGANATSIASGAEARPFVSDSFSDERRSAVIGNFSATGSAAAADQSAAGFAQSSARTTATIDFIDAAAATLTFRGGSSATSGAVDGSAFAGGGQYFDYYFSVTADSTFDLSYAFSARTLGCCGNRIELRDFTAGRQPIGHTIAGTDTSGTLTAALTAGSFYGLSVGKGEYAGVDAASVRGVGSRTFDFDDVIRFSITDPNATAPVPEPATWATMILGLAAIGSAARRRRLPAMA